ncbi:MAG: hypothetical protein ACYCPP_00300 [Nitrososphaerales archaeon]
MQESKFTISAPESRGERKLNTRGLTCDDYGSFGTLVFIAFFSVVYLMVRPEIDIR